MHALEWIAQHGTRLRSLAADRLRFRLERRKGECTWCGGQVGPGRRLWCGDACVEAFKLRCQPQVAARAVLARDRGICRRCGLDTTILVRHARHVALALLADHRRQHGLHDWTRDGTRVTNRSGRRNRRRRGRYTAELHRRLRRFGIRWEMNHRLPVHLGGGLCGLDNLETLCLACHTRETRLQARMRRAAKRRWVLAQGGKRA